MSHRIEELEELHFYTKMGKFREASFLNEEFESSVSAWCLCRYIFLK